MKKTNILFVIIILSVNLMSAADWNIFPIGGLKVKIEPFPGQVSKSTVAVDKENIESLFFDDNCLMVFKNELILNNLTYGVREKADKISIDNKKVSINGKIIEGNKLSEAKQLFLKQSEKYTFQKMGTHYVAVSTASNLCVYTGTNEENIERHELIAGDKTVIIENEMLTINKKNYGVLKTNSDVVINDEGVFIDGELKEAVE